MTRGRKIFYGAWTALTVLLVLFGWVQTKRLEAVSAERDRLRAQTTAALLSEAQSILDEAADQTGRLNLGNAQAGTGSAISLLKAAERVAPPGTGAAIAERIKALEDIRSALLQGDPGKTASGDLKREASMLRELLK
jgi:hypothetical protein